MNLSEMNPRITVVIITYKQQELIKRALDSVLRQKDFGLKEIIISDDCSPDKTWDVLMEYSRIFPKYIRAYRNEKNLGIYANVQKALSYVSETDLVLFLSGDDEYCDGFFEKLIKAVNENNVNLSSKYLISCDFQTIDPQGRRQIFKQNIISRYSHKQDMISLKLRHLIYGRSNAISFETIKQFNPIILDKGISYAENFFDIQPYLYSDFFYYFPFVGSNYYSSIGISKTMNNIMEYEVLKNTYQDMQTLPYLNKMDVFYLKYLENKYNYLITNRFAYLIKAFWFFLCGFKYPIILYRLLSNKVNNFFVKS